MKQLFYSLDEAAELAHCSTKTIQRAIHARKLQAFRPGRKMLIKTSDFDQWLKSTAVVPAADVRAQQSGVLGIIRRGA